MDSIQERRHKLANCLAKDIDAIASDFIKSFDLNYKEDQRLEQLTLFKEEG